MPQTKAQKQTVERVMHEWKHGELKGPDGERIESPKQAVAIGLSEAGASNRVTPKQNRHNAAHTHAAERAGGSGRQEAEAEAEDAPARNRSELYAQARRRGVPGRSKMNKAQLRTALAE